MKEIVFCSKKYWEFVRNLRNDPRVKNGFIQQENITEKQHLEYMHQYWNNFVICLNDGKPAGYARVIDNDISVCVHPDFQRMGIGKELILFIKENFTESVAKIKIENEASLALFEKCGFKKRYYILERQ